MAASAVVDASPLIHLAKGGYLDLLRLTGESVAVPVAVANEIRHRGPQDPHRARLGYDSVVDPDGGACGAAHHSSLGPGAG